MYMTFTANMDMTIVRVYLHNLEFYIALLEPVSCN